MTTGDIQLIREFVAASDPWWASLPQTEKDAEACLICGVKAKRMMQLAGTLKRFLEAYDKKHGLS